MTMDGSVECHNPSFYHCSVQVLFLLQKDFDHLDKVISLKAFLLLLSYYIVLFLLLNLEKKMYFFQN